MKASRVIGLMSGTSLDGLDLAYCQFGNENSTWHYEVKKASTLKYPEGLRSKLASAMTMTGFDLMMLDKELARFMGNAVNAFMENFKDDVDLIASHGHTVFHRPDLGLTTQIGSGAVIAAITGKDTVSDFRTTDVALGGQGAPLVPIGDELLYGQYDICLNLGGICNLSYRENKLRKAYDISPCNIVLNLLAQQLGHNFDPEGSIARQGLINENVLKQLNQLDYYQLKANKSLGREWIDNHFLPIIQQCSLPTPDILRTVSEHIAQQIATACNADRGTTMLITGGGAHNNFLIELIKEKFHGQVQIPDEDTIDFKEAIIFAFLGFLRANNLSNCIASVTGASRNSCGGAIYSGKINA